jgi:hypothetical protein
VEGREKEGAEKGRERGRIDVVMEEREPTKRSYKLYMRTTGERNITSDTWRRKEESGGEKKKLLMCVHQAIVHSQFGG